MNNSPHIMPLGPVMLDVEGLRLTDGERSRLCHPSVGAVILFTRNYQDKSQVTKLVEEIKSLRRPALLVAVDQEGGRVQRLQEGFVQLPPASDFGDLWNKDKQTAPIRAFESAYQMASELIDVGVDFSFAPVFDVNSQDNEVIGDRCFHSDPAVAAELLGAYIDGMHTAGMVAIAKHFPGHGGVAGDSHECLPVDHRSFDAIDAHDLIPYKELLDEIQGVMTAHVLFDKCADSIPTYSDYWLQTVLRGQLGFDGVVFSDDLTMQGAIDAVGEPSAEREPSADRESSADREPSAGGKSSAGSGQPSIVESAQRAIYAGCDMVLICNRPDLADELLEGLEFEPNQVLSSKLTRLSAN